MCVCVCVCVYDRERDSFNEFSIVNVFIVSPAFHIGLPGVSNPAPGELPSYSSPPWELELRPLGVATGNASA